MTNSTSETTLVPSKPFKDRILERTVGACTLYMLPVDVEHVISFRGAFMSNPVFSNGDDLRQGIVVSLLDKGSKKRNRFELADVLENRGAQVNFYNGGIGVGFSGRCLRKDLGDVMGVMAEQVKEPLLDQDEFQKARLQVAASIQRSLERTSAQAYSALCRHIYTPSHPNYSIESEEELRLLSEITLDSLHQYHEEHFGARDLVLVVVGDFDPDEVTRYVEAYVGSWKSHTSEPVYDISSPLTKPEESRLFMTEKSSIDVRMGHGVEIRMNDQDYIPLYLGNYILGGNFSSRLMDVIRDEMGLTYGIRSSLIGISRYYEGHWQISVTLSQDKLDKGIEATKQLVADYIETGATEDELEEKKTTIVGTFNVELATTRGLASNILRGVQNGFGTGYIDEFPRRINEVTLKEVNESFSKHVDVERSHLSMAGTIPTTTAVR